MPVMTGLSGNEMYCLHLKGMKPGDLVIGNSAYRNVPALPNPANDASDVAAAFRRLGFAVTLVQNGSFDDMRRGLLAFGQQAAGADMAAVYFGQVVGHARRLQFAVADGAGYPPAGRRTCPR